MTTIDPLPSWHEGPNKQAILDFIRNVTDENSPHYVAVSARIAVFDNDGTLWCEKPKVTEIVFIADLFKHNPEQAIASGHSFFGGIFGKKVGGFLSKLRHFLAVTIKNILADGRWLLREVIDGISTDEYKQWAERWLAQAQHPRFLRPYTELVYQPMLEVLQLFAQHGFKNYIVSGGSNYFVRAMCEPCYLIPPEQAIGSQLLTRVTDHDDQLQVEMRPIPWFFDNGAGKVLSIESRIDRHPIAAFGNSRGDIKMLRWASATPGALCMMVHHTDAEREYQYCPGNKVLDGASQYGWSMIDMKKDWREIFPAEKVLPETEK
jgi:phosphoglycolate phosphatase-like HAD superfamily hydrolase